MGPHYCDTREMGFEAKNFTTLDLCQETCLYAENSCVGLEFHGFDKDSHKHNGVCTIYLSPVSEHEFFQIVGKDWSFHGSLPNKVLGVLDQIGDVEAICLLHRKLKICLFCGILILIRESLISTLEMVLVIFSWGGGRFFENFSENFRGIFPKDLFILL